MSWLTRSTIPNSDVKRLIEQSFMLSKFLSVKKEREISRPKKLTGRLSCTGELNKTHFEGKKLPKFIGFLNKSSGYQY